MATTTTLPPVPTTTLTPDGLAVSNGQQRVRVSAATDLDPAGAGVAVSGEGFDPATGIYVALCRIPEAGAAPGPCTAGDEQAAWLSSSPPAYGVGVARPFQAGGRFEVELVLPAVIDETTDCREVACAVTTRRDDTAGTDRTLDLLVPVAFAEETTSTTTADGGELAASTAPTGDDDDGGSGAVPIVIAGVLVAGAAAAAGTIVLRRRRRPA